MTERGRVLRYLAEARSKADAADEAARLGGDWTDIFDLLADAQHAIGKALRVAEQCDHDAHAKRGAEALVKAMTEEA